MKDITLHDLRQMSSKGLRALLQFDSWQTSPENKLSRDTIERIHNIATERNDGESQALLRNIMTIMQKSTTNGSSPNRGTTTTTNGTANNKSLPPPEIANWDIEHASPDVLAMAAQTFDETEFLAAKREAERTGGVPIDDLIAEIEEKLKGGD